MKSYKHLASLLVFASLLLAGSGCATNPSTAKASELEPGDEYVTYTVTGSNIPKRIKKSDIAKGKLPKDADIQLADKDEFQKSLRPGRQIDKGN